MFFKIVFTFVLISLVSSDNDVVKLRIKRGKYSSNPPARFYKLPPPSFVVKGPFSQTPPPFKAHNDSPFRPKVSRRPIEDGLGDEDINNLVKHLSKNDLDKIIEFAGVKSRYTDKYVETYRGDSSERNEYSRPFKKSERTDSFRSKEADKFLNSPYVTENIERPYYNGHNNYVTVRPKIYNSPPNYPEHFDQNPNSDFANSPIQAKEFVSNPAENLHTKIMYFNAQENKPSSSEVELTDSRVVYENLETFVVPNRQLLHTKVANPTFLNNLPQYESQFSNPSPDHTRNSIFSNAPYETEESMNSKISYVTPPTNYENYINLYSNSSTMKEEELPRPLNLREEPEYVGSNTNNIPTVVNAESYRVESFKDLPLMNYHNSKLHTVSSYNVPHYTVTATKSSKTLPIERAPPGYSGREESDAHLKAVKIWTHHSTGAAYTLHDDGTLSPETPRTKYG